MFYFQFNGSSDMCCWYSEADITITILCWGQGRPERLEELLKVTGREKDGSHGGNF